MPRPYGSGTMFGVARIALAIGDGRAPRCRYAPSGPTVPVIQPTIPVPPLLSICTDTLNLRTQPAGTPLSSLTFGLHTIFALETVVMRRNARRASMLLVVSEP